MSPVLDYLAQWTLWQSALLGIAAGAVLRLTWKLARLPLKVLGRIAAPLRDGESPDSLERAGRPVVKTTSQRKKDYKRYKKIRSEIEARGVIDGDALWAVPPPTPEIFGVATHGAAKGELVTVQISGHATVPLAAPPAEAESVELLKGIWMQPLRSARLIAERDLQPGGRDYTELWCVRHGYDRYIDDAEARTLLERGTYWRPTVTPAPEPRPEPEPEKDRASAAHREAAYQKALAMWAARGDSAERPKPQRGTTYWFMYDTFGDISHCGICAARGPRGSENPRRHYCPKCDRWTGDGGDPDMFDCPGLYEGPDPREPETTKATLARLDREIAESVPMEIGGISEEQLNHLKRAAKARRELEDCPWPAPKPEAMAEGEKTLVPERGALCPECGGTVPPYLPGTFQRYCTCVGLKSKALCPKCGGETMGQSAVKSFPDRFCPACYHRFDRSGGSA